MTIVRKLIVLLLVGATWAWAQAPSLQPDVAPEEHAPTITFDFELPGGDPPNYSIAVSSTGRAAYRADPSSAVSTGEPYLMKFVVAEATVKRLFALAGELNYFRGDFEYHGGRVANMGAKTLTYTDGEKKYHTGFNYSQNPQIQELTRIFQGLQASLGFGQRLDYLYHHDKLGLDAELKSMEEQAKSKNLVELQVDQAILRQISDDHSVMNITRRRADRLLQMIARDSTQQASSSGRTQ